MLIFGKCLFLFIATWNICSYVARLCFKANVEGGTLLGIAIGITGFISLQWLI